VPYTYLTFGQLATALLQRLQDTAGTFTSPAEAQVYLTEALRVLNAQTAVGTSGQFGVDFQFAFSPGDTWKSLNVAGSPRQRTVTDVAVETQMEYMLLEPPSGGTWNGTSQFNITNLSNALQYRRDELLLLSGANTVNLTTILSPTAGVRTVLPDTSLDLRRVRWNSSITPPTASSQPSLPADAVIVGIYPVLVVASQYQAAVHRFYTNVSGSTFKYPFDPSASSGNTSFSTTEFWGDSIGSNLSVLATTAITVDIDVALIQNNFLDTITVSAVGYAITYTSATPSISTVIPPPFALSAGQGLQWALPVTVTTAVGNPAFGSTTASPASITSPYVNASAYLELHESRSLSLSQESATWSGFSILLPAPAMPITPPTSSENTGNGRSYGSYTLWREDVVTANAFGNSLSLQTGSPESWMITANSPLAFDISEVPNVPGSWDLLLLFSGTPLAPPAATVLGLPDDWCWVAMYGALADCLSNSPEATDQLRAKYCQMRYERGMKAMMNLPWLLAASVANLPVDTPSFTEIDAYRQNWEINQPSDDPTIVVGGMDLIALAPFVPSTGVTVSSVLTVAGNAPIPINAAALVQLSRDAIEAVLAYAQHIATFKRGGEAFIATLPLYEQFEKFCREQNQRYANLGIMRTEMLLEGNRADEIDPRYPKEAMNVKS